MAGAPKGNINSRKGLNLRQKRFCKEYVIDFNGRQAAIRAGYSSKSASVIATELLTKPNIKGYIKDIHNQTADSLQITHEMLTKEWSKMAFSSIAHLHNTWIELKEFDELKQSNPDIMDCIQEISTKIEKRVVNKELIGIEYVRLKLYDKQKALENLGKHIGYYGADNEQKKEPSNITLIYKGKEIDLSK